MNYQYQFLVKLCTSLCFKRYQALDLVLDYRERNGLPSYNAQIVQKLIHKVQESHSFNTVHRTNFNCVNGCANP